MFISKEFLSGSEIPWENTDPGIKRQILGYDEQLMMARIRFEKGAVGTVHQHLHRQATYVAKGSFEVQIREAKKVLQTGDAFFIPPYTDHGVKCLEEGELIDVFAPIREDFI